MSVQNNIFINIDEVFQIELSDGLVHPLGSQQIVNLCPTRVFPGAQVLCFCKFLQFKSVTPLSIQNRIFIGEVFIEVSAGLRVDKI